MLSAISQIQIKRVQICLPACRQSTSSESSALRQGIFLPCTTAYVERASKSSTRRSTAKKYGNRAHCNSTRYFAALPSNGHSYPCFSQKRSIAALRAFDG